MIKPQCFKSQAEYEGYMESLEATVQDVDRSYCWDCTHAYKAQMIEEKRCAHPMVYFVMIDGALVGKRPK